MIFVVFVDITTDGAFRTLAVDNMLLVAGADRVRVAVAADEPGRTQFELGRRLLDSNCADCMGASRQGLRAGVTALRQALIA
jgi:hypothetical protein